MNGRFFAGLIIILATNFAYGEDFAQLKLAAEKGEVDAEFQLGRAYLKGDGAERDFDRARELLLKAAGNGNHGAEDFLASMYEGGLGVAQDYTKAVSWYRKAAEGGVRYSQYNLAVLLTDGKGCEANPTEALTWYKKAADQGMVEAMLNLSKIYYFGERGIPQNYGEARKWLSEAGKKGDAWALNTLGVMNEFGQEGPKDPKAAAELYRKAAERGDSKGQANLGRMYAHGLGVKRDIPTAYEWLKLGADQHEVTAEKELDELGPTMTPEQIRQGDRLIAEYRKTVRGNAANVPSN